MSFDEAQKARKAEKLAQAELHQDILLAIDRLEALSEKLEPQSKRIADEAEARGAEQSAEVQRLTKEIGEQLRTAFRELSVASRKTASVPLEFGLPFMPWDAKKTEFFIKPDTLFLALNAVKVIFIVLGFCGLGFLVQTLTTSARTKDILEAYMSTDSMVAAAFAESLGAGNISKMATCNVKGWKIIEANKKPLCIPNFEKGSQIGFPPMSQEQVAKILEKGKN